MGPLHHTASVKDNIFDIACQYYEQHLLNKVETEAIWSRSIVGKNWNINEISVKEGADASATTLVSVRNTWMFRTALTAVTEPRTLWRRITCYPSPSWWVALQTYLLYFVVTFTHHQKDMCVTLFAGAAVMLKPFTQHLAMLNHWYYL